MNILFLANHFNVGGITSYILTLARGLKQAGHDVYVASSGGAAVGRLEKDRIPHIAIPLSTKFAASPKIWFSFRKLAPLVKEKDIGVIHANTRVTQVLAFLLARRTSRPYVTTCHGFFRPRFFRRHFPLWGCKVIAISREVAEHLRQDLRAPNELIRLIYHGIDTGRFQDRSGCFPQEVRREFDLGQGPVISVIARLSEVKGQRYLLESLRSVLDKFPAAKLVIAGEGKTEAELKGICASLRLGCCVRFIPSIEDTRLILGVTDVFVMPSLNEGLGLGVMEAMASGLAVVGSEVGGIKSLIRHGETGMLVRPADPAALSAAIIRLLGDQALRSRLGENAAKFIAGNFSLEEMLRKTTEVYQECQNSAS